MLESDKVKLFLPILWRIRGKCLPCLYGVGTYVYRRSTGVKGRGKAMDTWYSAANMTGDQQRYISRHLLYFTIRTHMYEISVHGRIASRHSRVVDLLRHITVLIRQLLACGHRPIRKGRPLCPTTWGRLRKLPIRFCHLFTLCFLCHVRVIFSTSITRSATDFFLFLRSFLLVFAALKYGSYSYAERCDTRQHKSGVQNTQTLWRGHLMPTVEDAVEGQILLQNV